MRKTLLLAATLIFMLSLTAMATDTRVKTMGDNNMILLDEANIWMFPSRIYDYPKIAVGEFGDGTGDFNQMGIHWKFGSDNSFVMGTYFTDLGAFTPQELIPGGGGLIPFDDPLMDNRRIDLFYGNPFQNFTFGAGFSYFQSGVTNDMAGDQSKEAFNQIGITLGASESSGLWDVAINYNRGSWTDRDVDGFTESDADGFYDFGLTARYFKQYGPDYTLVPHIGFMKSKRGVKVYDDDADPDLDETTKQNSTMFDLGIGVNYTPARNVLAVLDFGFMHGSWDQETVVPGAAAVEDLDETMNTIPYFKVGMDADVFKWMDIRLGATSYWTTETIKFPAAGDKITNKFASNETYLGFGFHWNRLHIDTYTDPGLFLRGFDFISGNGDASADMNFQISAVYEMM